jgi:hypothetical protein
MTLNTRGGSNMKQGWNYTKISKKDLEAKGYKEINGRIIKIGENNV